ncbi:MAG: precorrin-6y C5,15-methyltransferase (decarboxylating) subunit CbiE [Nitrospirae bacterium]|nr:precorrin-6y C5,15-methyltransferase (decarboxylating) subunit CbiE [Nitrospirota bacterium]
MNKVRIIGIGFRPLDTKAERALLNSDVVLVNDRLLGVFENYAEYGEVKDRIITHGNVYEMLDYIADNYQTKKIALLAAGDTMFFGRGRLVIERLGKDAAEVYPDLSSIQVAFSRIKETSNNALLISLHGGPDPEKRRKLEYELADVPRLLNRHSKIAILTDKVNSPEAIANVICRGEVISPQNSLRMYVCEKLGYDDEKVTEGTPQEISIKSFEHPNVVIIKNAPVGAWRAMPLLTPNPQPPTPVFGLKEDEIRHSRGLITKDEVRAVALHKLRLPKTGMLWDIGAGSGSVSVEASLLRPDLKIYAIEKDEEQVVNIRENKNRYEAVNIEIVGGHAPESLLQLPAPDRVFIGGSSGRLNDIVDYINERMPSGIAVINAATIETLHEAVQSLERNGFKVDVSEISVSRSKAIGGKMHMSALNPIFIVIGEKV